MVLTQSAIDAILIPFYAAFHLAYIVSYATAAMTSAYVSYRLHTRYLKNETDITIVELTILAMEAFIILNLCIRFIETSLLDSNWYSVIYGYVIDGCNYIILAILLMPFYLRIIDTLGIRQFVNIPLIQGKLARFMYSKVPDSPRRDN